MRKPFGIFITLMITVTSILQASFTPLIEGIGRTGDFLEGGGAQAWVPFYTNGRDLLFGQGGGGYFNKTGVVDLGVGYRRAQSRAWGWGVNGFIDYAQRSHRDTYFQLGCGAEAFGPCWAVRGNTYFPGRSRRTIGQARQLVSVVPTPPGANVTERLTNIYRQAYYGVDVEAGASIKAPGGTIWGFAGYYYFDAKRVKPVQGPSLRAEYRYSHPFGTSLEVIAGGEWHTDQLHGSQGAFELRVMVPLGRKARSSYATSRCRSVCKEMARPVRRQPTPFVFDDFDRISRIQATDLMIIFVEENGMGTGTQASPTNLLNAQAISDPNDVIILMTTAGDLMTPGPINLQEGQQWGSFAGQPSITVTIMGDGTVNIPNLFASGTAVVNGGASDIFSMANNSRLFDIITNGGQNGVVSVSHQNVLLENLTINNPTASGVNFTGNTASNLANVNVTGGTVSLLMANQAGANVAGSTFAGATTAALSLSNPTNLFTFTGNTFDPAGGTSVDISGGAANMAFTGNTVNALPGVRLLDINGGANTVTLMGGTFMTNGGDGVRVQNTTGGAINIATPASLQNTPTTALILNGLAGNFSMPNADIDPVAAIQGIDIDMMSGNATIGGTLDTSGAIAISVDNGSGAGIINLSGLTTNATGGAQPIQVSNNTGGLISFGPTTLTNPITSGFLFDTNTAAISVVDGDVTSNTPATAFRINNQTGGVTVTDGTLTLTGGGKIVDIDGGSSMINMAGVSATSSTVSATAPIDVQNTLGGSLTLATGGGESLSITNPTAQAILLNANAAAVNIGNLNITSNTTATGVEMLGQTGNATISGTMTQTAGGTAINVSNATGSTINLAGLTANNTGSATQVVNIDSTNGGAITLGATTTTNAATAINISNTSNGATITGSGLVDINNAPNTNAGVVVSNTDNSQVLFNGLVDINGAVIGIDIDATTNGGTVDFDTTTIINHTTGVEITGTDGTSTVDVGSAVTITGGTTGMDIQGNAGSLTFGEVTLTDQTGTGIAMGTTTPNSASATFNQLNMNINTGAIGLDAVGQTGNVTVTASPLGMNHTAGGISTRISGGTAVWGLTPMSISNDSAVIAPVQVTNTAGGAVNFGSVAINNITSTDSLLATTNGGSVDFTNLAVSGTSGLVNVNGGAGTFGITGGSIGLTTGNALSIQSKPIAAGGVTLASLTTTGGTPSVNLQFLTGPGSVSLGNTTITNPLGGGIFVNTTAVPITISNLNLNSTSGTSIGMQNTTGPVTISGVVQGGGGQAISVFGGTSVHNYTGLTANTNGTPGYSITVDGTTGGAVNFGPVVINNANVLGGLPSVSIAGNAGSCDFSSLTISGTRGRLDVNGGTGTFGITTGSISLSNNVALAIDNKTIAPGGLTLTNLSSTGASGPALSLNNVSGGPITIPNLTISNALSGAILVSGGSPTVTIGNPIPAMPTANITGGSASAITITGGTPTFTYHGGLLGGGPATFMADVSGQTGGTITINGRQSATANTFFAQTGGSGVRVANSAADFTLEGASSTGSSGAGFSISDSSGRVDLLANAVTSSTGNGISVLRQTGLLNVNSNTITMPGAIGIDVMDHRTSGTMDLIAMNTLVSPPGVGIRYQHLDAGSALLQYSGNTQTGPAGVAAITYEFIEGAMSGGTTISDIGGNSGTRTGAGFGISFDNQGGGIFLLGVIPIDTLSGVDSVTSMGTPSVNIGVPPPS